ncbi:hypothetical protein LTR36_005474 [Oleoguttula mirabilis]|uniref:Uncharacterized protein n=1 Tax=Oleoguttula mirabilis TaxID=1507867 RepID=A0AAV9JFL5_9PEZI|nr:hypothetical protein LTR36_005474 [Oleoguttula mirabilis]
MSSFDVFGKHADGDVEQLQGNQTPPTALDWPELGIADRTYDIGNSQPGPYYINQQEPATALPSDNVPVQDTMGAEGFWFWDTADSINKPNGVQVSGTYRQLYDTHPDLQQHILMLYQSIALADLDNSQYAARDAPPAQEDDIFAHNIEQPGAEQSQTLLHRIADRNARSPSQTQPADDAIHINTVESSATPNTQVVPQARVLPDANPIAESEPGDKMKKQAAAVAVAGVDAEDEAEAEGVAEKETENDWKAPAMTTPESPKHSAHLQQSAPPAAPRQPAANAPRYISDIASPEEAHSIVDHPDPKHCRKLEVEGDDFVDVKTNKLHLFAEKFFDAMLTPGVDNPTGHVFKAEAKDKFDKQQSGNLKKIQTLLKTKLQQREARASCILAFEAAIFVHEIGVPKDLFDQFKEKGARKSDRYAHLDVGSICSRRLEKMVQQVADYKLVAVDLLNGKKMHRLAYDPEYYSEQKIGYLVSNTTRQATTDSLNAERIKKKQDKDASKQGAKTVASKKRKRTAEADSEQEAGAVDEPDEEERDAKRAK